MMNFLEKWGGLLMGLLTIVGGGCEIASWAIDRKINKEAENEIPESIDTTRT